MMPQSGMMEVGMKIACNVIRDLMVLYEDDACSEESRELVERHLKECRECTEYLKKIRHTEELLLETDPDIQEAAAEEERIIKKCFRKIRLRWTAILMAVLMLFPIVGVGILGVHEYTGEGIAFSNLDDIYRCISFLRCIHKKDFEAAAAYVDFTGWDYSGIDGFRVRDEEEFVEYMRARYIKKLQEYDELGISLSNIKFEEAYRGNFGDTWSIVISADEDYPDGSFTRVRINMNGDSMRSHASSVRVSDDSKIVYITEVLNLWIQDDPLGYHDRAFGFEVAEGEKAVIALTGPMENEEDIYVVSLVNTTFGASAEVRRSFLAKNEIEVSVPGRYSIIAVTYSHGDINLAEEENVEITIYPLER